MNPLNENEKVLTQKELSGFLESESKNDKNNFEILIINEITEPISPSTFNEISKHIKESGELRLISLNFDENFKKELTRSLNIAGFVNVKDNGTNISSTKKAWKTTENKKNPWKLMKTTEDDIELIDEDELIDPDNTYQKFSKKDDCITKPKPCKNCNCGRAAKDNDSTMSAKGLNEFKSNCGKCYLGDAFRCSGCPYRGKPAFEPGMEPNIDLGDAIEVETTTISVTKSTVKLDL